jgi:hypothetical protein
MTQGTKVLNFGTSAYLKILALNPKPRDTALRNRRSASSGGGYDFHKAMRRIAAGHVTGELSIEETLAEFGRIEQSAERQSAIQAVNQLVGWLRGAPVTRVSDERRVLSPSGVFSVRFVPDIAVTLDGKRTLIHLWNTKQPKLTSREAIGTLGLFVREYEGAEIGVLCLRTRHLYATSEHTKSEELARMLALDVERRLISGETEDRDRLIAVGEAARS